MLRLNTKDWKRLPGDSKSSAGSFRLFWTWICMFHDIGYSYEDPKTEEKKTEYAELKTIDDFIKHEDIKYSLLDYSDNKDLIRHYYEYRMSQNKLDHGIVGALLLFNALMELANNSNYAGIYSEIKNYDEASKYYQKALESIDENTSPEGLAELYFKYALMCDENDDDSTAFEYYSKCIYLNDTNSYKALSYSNMGSCYFENDNYSDAEACFSKAYNIEKNNNNYEGIYYTASYLAKIYMKSNPQKALKFLTEAKQSAEFLNEDFYILEATIALGDYYYNNKATNKEALTEYFKALKISKNYGTTVDIEKIQERISDMKIRVDKEDFEKLEKKYG
jgi:tetratricopeptide (TPR) repeat protein